MSASKMASFSEHQQRFAAYIKDPVTEPLPVGLEARRMKIYSELFYNNVESFISSGFPILRKITRDDLWHAMVKDFFINHSCQSPYFLEISSEFLSYLQNERSPQPGDPEFLLELAHYEWVELAMDTSEDEIPELGFNPEGDLMAASPFLSPLAVALQYRYDVHNIGEHYQPDEAPGEATYLLVYRNRENVVRFMEINVVTARLLALMQERVFALGSELVKQIADELTHIDKEVVFEGGQQALEHLKNVGVVFGTKLRAVDCN